MKSQTTLSILFFFCFSVCLFGQYYPSSPRKNNDIATLEKLNSMMERDNAAELGAKQTVTNYRNEIRAEMREIFRFVTDEQAKELFNREKVLWEMATQNLQYSKSYQDFYRQNYELLESYKRSMLDYISKVTN